MKSVIPGEGKVIVHEVGKPLLKNNEILVKLKACGICGSDLEKVYGSYGMVSKKVGHELAGIVEESKNNKFKKNDRVFVHHHVPCYSCYYCKKEDYILCETYQKSNVEPNGLAEFFLVPEHNVEKGGVIKIPDKMSFEEASMIEPLACCIKAVNKLNVKKDDNIIVIGAGPAGMMNILLLKNLGANVFSIEINDYRMNLAKKYCRKVINPQKEDAEKIIKNETEDRGADAVLVAVSSPKAVEQAIKLVRKGGKVMIFGVPPKNSSINIDANYIFSNEISILTSGYSSEKETNEALKLIESGKIDVKSLITHTFRIDEAEKAFALAHSGEGMKIVIVDR